MKKLISFVLGVALISISGLVSAQTQESIRVLDMRQLMDKSAQIATIRENLRKEFQPRQQKILDTQTTLKTDAERLRRDNAIMNNNDRKQLEQKIITEQQNLTKMQDSFRQDLMNAQNKALKGFLATVKTAVDKVAEEEKADLVLTKDTVAFAKPSLDVTNKVISKLPRK